MQCFWGRHCPPAVDAVLRCNGAQAWFGWPSSSRIEALREAVVRRPDLATQSTLAARIQAQAFEDPPYYPLGFYYSPTAYRADLIGALDGGPFFWNSGKVERGDVSDGITTGGFMGIEAMLEDAHAGMLEIETNLVQTRLPGGDRLRGSRFRRRCLVRRIGAFRLPDANPHRHVRVSRRIGRRQPERG